MLKMIRASAAFALVLVLTGCQSGLMIKSSGAGEMVASNEAMVVFLRPSSFGGASHLAVYDVTGGTTTFGGIVSSKTQVSMHLPAGEHLLMVVAKNCDFMNITLAAGKTYYVLVMPRMGAEKTSFSLIPIHNDPSVLYNLQSKDFASWKLETQPVEKSPTADAWYAGHKAAIEARRLDSMQTWNQMAPEDKAVLTEHAQDGI